MASPNKIEMASPPRVGRPRTVSSATKKLRKRNYKKATIHLIDSFEDWKALKDVSGWTHSQVARHLMEVHAAHCSHEECSANWERASSSLGASEGVQLAPEESRSRSRPTFEETEPTTSQIATSIIIVEPPDETTSGEVVDADFNISDIEPLEDRLLPATTASTSKESPQGSQLDINIDYEVRGDYVYLSSSNNTLR
ncbi:uncharacterized protein [Apostichopus japonicus]|uniref:uncharacterized protein isoform X1 n=1 Tax=Stichopus japonicus TaxID=307972 RepID=UPI003AB6D7FC